MRYKTIVLEILKAQPKLHEKLRKEGKLLTTLGSLASELKTRHEELIISLIPKAPTYTKEQLANEALETAISEFKQNLKANL